VSCAQYCLCLGSVIIVYLNNDPSCINTMRKTRISIIFTNCERLRLK
jgi:hypothetical protein